jgi:pectinesterase
MASRGFVGACVQYRKLPEARFPGAVFDLKAAVRWLRANAARYRIDQARIGAAGGSGGGHMVGMLGTTIGDPSFEGDVGGNLDIPSSIAAVVAFNPAMDWVEYRNPSNQLSDLLIAYLGCPFREDPGTWIAASPFYHVSSRSAPFLFLCGDEDPLYGQSTQMMEALHAAGVRAELYTASGAAHGFFNTRPWFDPTLRRMEQFFDRVLR